VCREISDIIALASGRRNNQAGAITGATDFAKIVKYVATLQRECDFMLRLSNALNSKHPLFLPLAFGTPFYLIFPKITFFWASPCYQD
jgi:hypothetical protein